MYTITSTLPYNYWLMPSVTVSKEKTPSTIIDAACTALNVSRGKLLSKSRTRQIAMARFICFRIMRKDLHLTLEAIAKVFKRDHTTIIHGLRCIEDSLSVAAYRQEINEKIRAVKMLL